MKKNTGGPSILKIIISGAILLLAWAVNMGIQSVYGETLAKGFRLPYSLMSWLALGLFSNSLVLLAVWAPRLLKRLNELRSRFRWLGWILASGIALAISIFFTRTHWSNSFTEPALRLMIYISCATIMAWLTCGEADKSFSWASILASVILLGAVFTLAYQLREVVNYPFRLSWSEGNRFWDYSVLFGRRLYDYPADKPIFAYIDLGRQSLWGSIFLLPQVSIQGMRLWDALIYTIPYMFLGWALLRLHRQNWALWLFFGLWTMLFLNQGPIYTPLVLAAILVVLTRRSPLWLGILLVGLAGYYARNTRYTWQFAPAIWAGLIAFLELKDPFKKRWLRAILLGLGGLLGGYILPEYLPKIIDLFKGTAVTSSGSTISLEGISAMVGRQPLLWDRLWPNATYPLGIIYALLLAAGPLFLLFWAFIIRRRWKLDPWQIIAITGCLLAFLGVGLVVSVKIGGGSNLHNLDMFLICLLLSFGVLFEQWVEGEALESKKVPETLPWPARILLLAAIIYPAGQNMLTVTPIGTPRQELINNALNELREKIAEKKDSGEILFIDQRQLLTFGYVEKIPLVPDYEKKYLMDQAMTGDQVYFDHFYQDLAAKRFALIVTEPLNAVYQGDEHNFGNENDAWVKWVSIPILCYYEPIATHEEVGMIILTPRDNPMPPEEGVVCPNP